MIGRIITSDARVTEGMAWLAAHEPAMAAAYDVPVIPHGSGNYSYHFVISQPHSPFVEYLNTSPQSDQVNPVFGGLFENEAAPVNGVVHLDDAPGFGLDLDRSAANLIRPYGD